MSRLVQGSGLSVAGEAVCGARDVRARVGRVVGVAEGGRGGARAQVGGVRAGGGGAGVGALPRRGPSHRPTVLQHCQEAKDSVFAIRNLQFGI